MINSMKTSVLTIACAVLLVVVMSVSVSGCKHSYERPAQKTYLGKVSEFLGPFRHLQSKGVMVFRDEKGWSVLGTRCTYDGCDLTHQSDGFICSCCRSYFDTGGRSLTRPARNSLDWYTLIFEQESFFVDTGKKVDSTYRFDSEEIQALVQEIQRRNAEAIGIGDTKIPEILRGDSDGEGGVMFVEPKPQDFKERYDIDSRK